MHNQMEKRETHAKTFGKIRVDPSRKTDTACFCVGVEFNLSARFQNVGKHIVNPHGNMQAGLHGTSNQHIEPERLPPKEQSAKNSKNHLF